MEVINSIDIDEFKLYFSQDYAPLFLQIIQKLAFVDIQYPSL